MTKAWWIETLTVLLRQLWERCEPIEEDIRPRLDTGFCERMEEGELV